MNKNDAKELEFRKSLIGVWDFVNDGIIEKEEHKKLQTNVLPNEKERSADTRDILSNSVYIFLDELACSLESNGFTVETFVVSLVKNVVALIFNPVEYSNEDLKLSICFEWVKSNNNKNKLAIHWVITHDNCTTTYPRFWLTE